MKDRKVLTITISFVAGIACAILVPVIIRTAANHLIFPENYREVARVTSPDGVVDAVMGETNCGAPCSLGYSVSVVPKGSPAPRDPAKHIFIADDLVNPHIRWEESHLLEIGYDKALIHSFRNVAYPLGHSGKQETWRYAVEVRLMPSSSRFSYLEIGNLTNIAQ